jgi:hypothetical protein
MQPTVSSFLTPLALKTAGIVVILTSLIDLLFKLWFSSENMMQPNNFPAECGSLWWLTTTSQLVEGGLLPLIGISFIVAGDWIKIVSTEDGGDQGNAWRIGTFGLASLLGLIFVLIIPFQLNGTNCIKTNDLKNLSVGVTKAQEQVKANLAEVSTLSPDDIKKQTAAVNDEIKKLAGLLSSGTVQGENLIGLKASLENLQAKSLLLSDSKKFAQVQAQKLQTEKQTMEDKASKRMIQTGARTSLASFLLAIAYITIGWTGLRRVLR